MSRNTDKYRYNNIIEKKYIIDNNNNKSKDKLKQTLDLIHKTLISLQNKRASSSAARASSSVSGRAWTRSVNSPAARASSPAPRASSSASGRAWTRSVNSPATRASSPAPRASSPAARRASSYSSTRGLGISLHINNDGVEPVIRERSGKRSFARR